jgi:hypothetical protein
MYVNKAHSYSSRLATASYRLIECENSLKRLFLILTFVASCNRHRQSLGYVNTESEVGIDAMETRPDAGRYGYFAKGGIGQ